MKKIMMCLTVIVIAATAFEAHAQCVFARSGWMYVNHYSRFARGNGFQATLSCSRGAPTAMYLRGGMLCRNRYIYGRTAWNRPFSCRVNAVWRGR